MSDPAPSPPPQVSVLLPAHDEAGYIGACLRALLASEGDDLRAQVIVVANGCTDATAAIARSHAETARARGWRLEVIETPDPGKLAALNAGEAAARAPVRVYLDADVQVATPLLGQIVAALAGDAPRYASGRPVLARAPSRLTRLYARFWARLPFAAGGVPGFGFFAVNASGRARWGAFPDIISDDTFVRLHFAPDERIGVPATYRWPVAEGLGNLVRVRRRQDAGVAEIARRFPDLPRNAGKTPRGAVLRLALRDPAGFAAYALIRLAVRTPLARTSQRWARGR